MDNGADYTDFCESLQLFREKPKTKLNKLERSSSLVSASKVMDLTCILPTPIQYQEGNQLLTGTIVASRAFPVELGKGPTTNGNCFLL